MLPSSMRRSPGEFDMNTATPTGVSPTSTTSGSVSGAAISAARYARSAAASANGPPFIHRQISASGSYASMRRSPSVNGWPFDTANSVSRSRSRSSGRNMTTVPVNVTGAGFFGRRSHLARTSSGRRCIRRLYQLGGLLGDGLVRHTCLRLLVHGVDDGPCERLHRDPHLGAPAAWLQRRQRRFSLQMAPVAEIAPRRPHTVHVDVAADVEPFVGKRAE